MLNYSVQSFYDILTNQYELGESPAGCYNTNQVTLTLVST